MFISIYEPGDYISKHIDSDGGFNFFETASVFYLNYFDNGEIVFPELNFSYKPMPGDAIFFPCNGKKSTHYTNLSKCDRITVASWYGYEKKISIKNLEENYEI